VIRPELRADRPQALGTKNYDLMVIGTGSAMNLADKDYFVKVTMEKETERILGAHIGALCFMLIQELVNAMHTGDRGPRDLRRSMYAHPAINEVVERALYSMQGIDEYNHLLSHEHPHK